VVGRRPRQSRLAGDDQQHRRHLARADRLVERAGCDEQQDQEARCQRRLHRGERRGAQGGGV